MSVIIETPAAPPQAAEPRKVGGGLLDPRMLWKSTPDAFRKLDPRVQLKNPVMFVVEVGAVLTLYTAISKPSIFNWTIVVWLFLTVVFANLAEAVAEGRGKAQADTLRRAKRETMARRLIGWQPAADSASVREESVAGTALQLGDYVVVEAGQVIPGDGDVVEGVAAVDESAITGESAPVIRESGGDRSAVTGGTTVLSDRIVVKITSRPGDTFIDRMIALVEGAKRQKTPNEIALNILLASLTIIFMLAVISLQPMAFYSKAPQSLVILVALLVALIPTTIGALLSAIGIAGMDRLVQRNVLAVSGRAVEAAGDVNTLLLDKTGTITIGNRQASEFLPVGGVGGPVDLRWRRRGSARSGAAGRRHLGSGRHAAGSGRTGGWNCSRTGRDPPQGHRQGGHRRAVRRDAQDGHQDRHDHRRQPADGQGHRGRVRGGRLPGRGHAGRQD